jgi:hypothetical protein
MTTSPKTLRTRNMTAAKRSLTLIRDAVLTHLDILEEGNVPESSFGASVVKYETALSALRTLDALGENDAGEATVEVRADALEALVLFAHGFVTEEGRAPGSPIDELTRAVYPDGIVPAEQP